MNDAYKILMSDHGSTNKKRKKSVVIFAVVHLFLLTIMFSYILYSIYEISKLKQEVTELKTIIKGVMLKNKGPINQIEIDNLKSFHYDHNNSYFEAANKKFETNDNTSYDEILMQAEKLKTETNDSKTRLRHKREILGCTHDGISINSDSLTELRRRNRSFISQGPNLTSLPSLPNSYSAEDSITYEISTIRSTHSKRNHAFHQQDKLKGPRQPSRKSLRLRAGDSTSNSQENEFTVITEDYSPLGTRVKHRHLEGFDERPPRMGRMRPLNSAHFSGTTSKYILGQHMNFNGNGHLKHLQRTYMDWEAANWVSTLGMDRHYAMTDGVLTVKDTGLYFIYAQIYHLDEHDVNGFRVYKNDVSILQCTTTGHSSESVMKGNTCFTAGMEYLQEGDHLSVRDLFDSRYSLFETGKSFFGVIKLGDIKIR